MGPRAAALEQHRVKWNRGAIPFDPIKLLYLLKRAGNFIGRDRTVGSISADIALAALLIALGGAASAEDFYRDKTLRILTSAVGSSYDAYARLVARYIPRHVAGGLKAAIVQDMPGATIKIPLYLTEVAASDPTVMAVLNNAAAFAPLLGVPQADFDPTRFNWLGSPSTEIALAIVWHAVPVRSIEEARRREVIMGVGAGGSSAAFFGRLLNTVLGTRFRLLSGYSGIASIYLAMERGEVEGVPAALWSDLRSTQPQWIAEKKITMLVQYGRQRAPELDTVPLARALVARDADLQLLDSGMAPLDMGRPFVMAPAVPAPQVAIMRAALRATFGDADFIAEAKQHGFDLDPVPKTGDDLRAIVTRAYDAPAPVRARLAELYKQAAN